MSLARRGPWKYRLMLKDLLKEHEDCDFVPSKEVVAIAAQMQVRLDHFGKTFRVICPVDFKRVRSTAQFNKRLDRIYDWADEERIWIV